MNKRLLVLVLLLALLSGLIPAVAQENKETPHPFLQMLDTVPAMAVLASDSNYDLYISYADYRALEAARDGVPSPETLAELSALEEADDFAGHLWRQNSMRLSAGWEEYHTYLRAAAGMMPETVGFDFFDIDRALTFLPPPMTGVLFGGEFNVEAMTTAYTAQGYTLKTVNGIEVWCFEGNCENGLETNLGERYLGRVFGDQLGRRQPVVTLPETIFSAASFEMLDAWTATYQDEADSLLDVPEFRAIAEAATADDGSLVQVIFFSPAHVAVFSNPALLLAEDNPLEALTAGYNPFPIYSLAALVDRQEGAEQVVSLALTYASEDAAQQAAEEVARRMQTFYDINYEDTIPLLEDEARLGAVTTTAVVYASETARRYVALVEMRYPMPDNVRYSLATNEPVDEDSDEMAWVRASGQLIRALLHNIMMRSFTPIMVDWGLE